MSYTWTTGETITAEKLNNTGGALICTYAYDDDAGQSQLDKTVQEIYDAYVAGTPVYIKYAYGTFGASGTGSYISHTYLAPVIKIYGYAYTDTIRICASWAKFTSTALSSGTGDFLHLPSLVLFSASGMSDHPVFYKNVFATESSSVSSDDME